MKRMTIILLLTCAIPCMAQSPGAAPYLARVHKYNEVSSFEDVMYKNMDWQKFYKLEIANTLVDPVNYDFDALNAAMFFAVNKYRESKGVPVLKFEPRLRDAATIHSYEMVKKNFFDHWNTTDPKIKGPDNRMELCGYKGQRLSENLARDYADRGKPLTYTQLADKTVKDLSKSSEHNKHMLDAGLDKLGCAVIFEDKPAGDGIIYFLLTQDYGKDW